MRLFRPLANLVILSVYLLRFTLFQLTRLIGYRYMVIPIGLAAIELTTTGKVSAAGFWAMLFLHAACRVLYPKLALAGGPRLIKAPAAPPPPPPKATAASGRADDPDEATVIGRLDPKLRDLLRQKTDGAAS